MRQAPERLGCHIAADGQGCVVRQRPAQVALCSLQHLQVHSCWAALPAAGADMVWHTCTALLLSGDVSRLASLPCAD